MDTFPFESRVCGKEDEPARFKEPRLTLDNLARDGGTIQPVNQSVKC